LTSATRKEYNTDMKTLWSGLVPAASLPVVKNRIAKLAVRADRIGFPAPILSTLTEPALVDWNGRKVEAVEVSIEADGALSLGDYTFAGTIAPLADGTPFVTWAPGWEDRAANVEFVNFCDHCNTVRARRDTYLVHGPEGYRQVGSSCIKDFTGHDPKRIASYVAMLKDVDDLDSEVNGWYMSAPLFYDPEEVLGYACRIVAKAGYVNKDKAWTEGRAATVDIVREFLSSTGAFARDLHESYPPSPESDSLYANVKAAIEEAGEQPTGTWMGDVQALVKSPGVQWRHVGIVASATVLGLRRMEKAAVSGESEFIGEVGERRTFNVKVTMKRGYESAYGQGYVIRMSEGDNDLLWFGSGNSAATLEEGYTGPITATVKAHELDSRTGRQTTVVTRVQA